MPSIELNLRSNKLFVILASTCVLVAFYLYSSSVNSLIFLDDVARLPSFHDESANVLNQILYHTFNGPVGRILSRLSFLTSDLLFGANYAEWKQVNVVLHIINGILLFFLAYKLTSLVGYSKHESRYFSLFCAVLWLLHPFQVSTVLYLVQRITILATLFSISTIILYILAREAQETSLVKSRVLFLLTGLSFFLSVISKEIGILNAFYIGLVEWLILSKRMPSLPLRKNVWLILYCLIPIIFILSYLSIFNQEIISTGYRIHNFDMKERMLTELRVMVYYLKNILIPDLSQYGFLHDDFIKSESMLSPLSTLGSFVLIASLLLAAFYYRKKHIIFSLGIFLYFSSQLLESTIIPLELVFEHRMYFASYGVIISCAAIYMHYFKDKNNNILALSPIAILVIFSFVTYIRLDIWKKPQEFYSQIYKTHKSSERVNGELANRFLSSDKYKEARLIASTMPEPFRDLFSVKMSCRISNVGHLPDVKEFYKNNKYFVDTKTLTTFYNLVNLYLDKKCDIKIDELLGWTNYLVSKNTIKDSSKGDLLLYKAHLLHSVNREPEAIEVASESSKYYRHNPYPLFLVVKWGIDKKNYNLAKKYLDRSITLIPFWDYRSFDQAKLLSEKIPNYSLRVWPRFNWLDFGMRPWS